MIVAAFVIYSAVTTNIYKRVRIEEVSKTAAFESEWVCKLITQMERNAVDLALAGQQFYRERNVRRIDPVSDEVGISIVIENFSAFTAAAGGGIWFEPYVLNANTRRLSYYAFFDPAVNAVRHDPEFASEQYDYHNHLWYKTITAEISGKYNTVWTMPYYDAAGTNALMTTVGSGIFNEQGQFIGMSTVDWKIQSMVEKLSNVKPSKNSFVLLASPTYDFIILNTYQDGTEYTGSSLSLLPWYADICYAEDDTVGIGRFNKGKTEYISFSRVLDNGWLFSIQIPAKEIFAEVEVRNYQFSVIIVLSFITLIILVSFLLTVFINHPLKKLTIGVMELGSGNLDKQIEIKSKDEIGTLANVFNKMTIDLKVSIERYAQERAEKERIGAELDVATKIQASMLPCTFPAFPGRKEFDIFAMMQPAKEVGGDFYDFFLVSENTLAIVIADVSGKGIPAALFMVVSKTLIKDNAQNGKSPKQVMEDVNNILCGNNDAAMFVTVFMGFLDIPSGKFTFVNAGHNPPLLRSADKYDWLKTKPDLFLAAMENTSYKENEIYLKPGDELFLYTDGVTEAVDKEENMFSDPYLLETANKNQHLSLKEFTISVKDEIDKFANGAEQADDITMLILRYDGSKR
ncbi:MAG: SpoIIE family protein phosphatase [Treponema sp.]|nr:SpoIIE family protein phosphatase [Treponema sp.]